MMLTAQNSVRVFDADSQSGFVAEAVVVHAQAEARLAGTHRIGAEGGRRFQHGFRAGGGCNPCCSILAWFKLDCRVLVCRARLPASPAGTRAFPG